MSVGVGLTVKIRLYSCMGTDGDGGVGGQMDGLLRIGCVTGLSIVRAVWGPGVTLSVCRLSV